MSNRNQTSFYEQYPLPHDKSHDYKSFVESQEHEEPSQNEGHSSERSEYSQPLVACESVVVTRAAEEEDAQTEQRSNLQQQQPVAMRL